jgi:hypothetical protein
MLSISLSKKWVSFEKVPQIGIMQQHCEGTISRACSEKSGRKFVNRIAAETYCYVTTKRIDASWW